MNSPSQELLSAAAAAQAVRDDDGRELAVRRLSALDRLRLFKAIGPALSQNTPYLGMAMLAASVTAIDGMPVPFPTTEQQLEGLVAKLGDTGIVAIADVLSQNAEPGLGSADEGN